MAKKQPLSFPDKELNELESKVNYLFDKNTYHLKKQDIALTIGTTAANLRNYLKRKRYLTLELALKFLYKLNKRYKRQLKGWKPSSPKNYPHNQESSPEIRSPADFTPSTIHFQALMEITFEHISRTTGTPRTELQKKLDAKIAEIKRRSGG